MDSVSLTLQTAFAGYRLGGLTPRKDGGFHITGGVDGHATSDGTLRLCPDCNLTPWVIACSSQAGEAGVEPGSVM